MVAFNAFVIFVVFSRLSFILSFLIKLKLIHLVDLTFNNTLY